MRAGGMEGTGRICGGAMSGRSRTVACRLAALALLAVSGCGGGDAAGERARAGSGAADVGASSSAGDSGPAASDAGAERATGTRPAGGEVGGDAYIRPSAGGGRLVSGDTLAGHPAWTEEDWAVLRETVTHARRAGIDTLPAGERIAALGRRFVGTPYVPRTLDPPGEERLVINLRALDCVTFVEAMITLAHFLERAPEGILADRGRAIGLYEDILTSIRYRDGRIDGYASRLHYFSEWLLDNAEKGYVRIVTGELGGVVDPEPIDFMTSHRDAYDQLADPAAFEAIERIEERLSRTPRHYIPQEEVVRIQDRIRTGDVIAATSTLDGLDVAHTGIALREDGVLKLMHAPLVGEAVQISERPLADRLLGLSAQDGIMVARPLDPSHRKELP